MKVGDLIIVRGVLLRITYAALVTGHGAKGPYSYWAIGTERAA